MSAHLVTTRSTIGTCRRCSGIVRAGWSGGLSALVSVDPVTWVGEVAAVASGLATYDLTAQGELWHRDVHRMRSRSLPVLIEHRCGWSPHPSHLVPPEPERNRPNYDNPPPF